MKPGWVYLMANHRRGRTYPGVTSNLLQRAWQHREGVIDGHSKDKGCTLLVRFDRFDDLHKARACEYSDEEVEAGVETAPDRGT